MPWLARLDARAARASVVVRWPYLALRWLLIAMGCWLAVYQGFTELSEHRVGLGSGIVVVGILALIKGIALAVTGSTPDSSPET